MAPCNASDTAQQWRIKPVAPDSKGEASFNLMDGGIGLCVGCSGGPCANTASTAANGTVTGVGLGMQACQPPGSGAQAQQFGLSSDGRIVQPKTNS